MKSSTLQKNIYYCLSILVALAVSYQFFHARQKEYLGITTFTECVDGGYSVLPTYPETCVVYGKKFINPNQQPSHATSTSTPVSDPLQYKNLSYMLDGEVIQFTNGQSELTLPNGDQAGAIQLTIMDTSFPYDLNNDGTVDYVILIRASNQNTARIAYFLSAAVTLKNGLSGVNALFLDYSLIDAAFVYKNGEIQIGYTTSEATSTLKQKYFILENDILKQLSHN